MSHERGLAPAPPWWVSVLGAMSVGALLTCAAPVATAYDVVTVTNGGTIEGVVKLTGDRPVVPAIKVTKNQDYCGQTIPNPMYEVGKDGGLQNVVVYLKEIAKGKANSTDPIELKNEHCMFAPRVQAVSVGQSIKISSADPILHNTHPQDNATNTTLYNIALPFKGFSVTKPLPGSPGLIKVKCDAHEWMHAWILELPHPYAATTAQDGHFVLRDVPPGAYQLVAWHEALGEKTSPVTVAAGQTAKTDFQFAAK